MFSFLSSEVCIADKRLWYQHSEQTEGSGREDKSPTTTTHLLLGNLEASQHPQCSGIKLASVLYPRMQGENQEQGPGRTSTL